jgi:broad specificity phosphatase PhoE
VTAIYVLRHPETTWNVVQRYQGRLEAPLSERGERQVSLICHAFEADRLEAVHTSGLQRARRLAERLAGVTEAPLRIDNRLTEIAQGPWEGLNHEEIRQRFPEIYRDWYERPDVVRFPGGESLGDVRNRALSALGDVFHAYPDGNVAVVTHSVVVQMIVASALSLPLRLVHRLHVRNASVTTICGSDLPGALLAFDVTSYLYGSPVDTAAAENCVRWRERRT